MGGVPALNLYYSNLDTAQLREEINARGGYWASSVKAVKEAWNKVGNGLASVFDYGADDTVLEIDDEEFGDDFATFDKAVIDNIVQLLEYQIDNDENISEDEKKQKKTDINTAIKDKRAEVATAKQNAAGNNQKAKNSEQKPVANIETETVVTAARSVTAQPKQQPMIEFFARNVDNTAGLFQHGYTVFTDSTGEKTIITGHPEYGNMLHGDLRIYTVKYNKTNKN